MVVVIVVVAVLVVGLAGAVAWRLRRRPPTPVEAAGSATVAPASTAPSVPEAGPSPDAGPVAAAPAAAPAEAEPAMEAPAAAESAEPGEPEAGSDTLTDTVVAEPPRLRDRLDRTRGRLTGYLRGLRGRRSIDASTWDDLEAALLGADVGVATTTALLDQLRADVAAGKVTDGDQVLEALRAELVASMAAVGDTALRFEPDLTNVWLFVGVNGVGKTTTIGKVARQQVAAGRRVLLAAGDTFRAAAADQLAQWAGRAEVEIVRGAEGGDPSAVVFDAVQRAAARGHQLVLADTAGRLHTKVNLVEELKKIRRVADRPPGTVTEVLLVLDATTGQNGLVQAREFLEAVGVTGVVLTKLDGTAKGGVVVAVQRELGIPVKLVGIGEGPDDLVPFDPRQFVDALFDEVAGEDR
jgi:fused signal recognition particle receptor